MKCLRCGKEALMESGGSSIGGWESGWFCDINNGGCGAWATMRDSKWMISGKQTFQWIDKGVLLTMEARLESDSLWDKIKRIFK